MSNNKAEESGVAQEESTASSRATDAQFAATVERMVSEYERLSDAKLAKKIRHLRKAARRCSLQRNADLIIAFHTGAMAIARRRAVARELAVDPQEPK